MKIQSIFKLALLLAFAWVPLSLRAQGPRQIPLSVNTVAELADLSFQPIDKFHGEVIRVHERGGFDVKYDKDSVATVDGGFVFAATVQGRFVAVHQNFANIVQFGAIDGDGLSDSVAIQAAADSGKPVFVPVGSFHSNAEINLPDGCRVYGMGKGSTITAMNSQAIFKGNSSDDITIEDLHLVGEGSSVGGDPTIGNLIFFQTCTNSTVRRCDFEGYSIAATHIRLCKNTIFQNNFCHDASINADTTHSTDFLAWGTNTGIQVLNNRLVTDVSQNIYVAALAGDENIVISGNYCDTLDANMNPKIPVIKRHNIGASYQTTNALPTIQTITGNICRNSLWSGIYVNGSGSTINIAGNTCYANGQADTPLGGGIVVIGGNASIKGSTDINVTGNTISNTQGPAGPAGIRIAIANTENSDDSGRVLVSSNFISNCVSKGLWITGDTGNMHVVGNQIRKVGGPGVQLDNVAPIGDERTAIGDNLLIGNRIEVTGTSRGLFLHHINPDVWLVHNNVIVSNAIRHGAFDPSVETKFPDARQDQIIIIAEDGTIDGLVMSEGDWVQSQADQPSHDDASDWAIIAEEGNGYSDDVVRGIHTTSENVSIMGNTITGFVSGLYFANTQTARLLDPPRVKDNEFRHNHAGIVLKATGNGLVPIENSNRFEHVESSYGDQVGYTSGALPARINEDGTCVFRSAAIPAVNAKYVKGDIAYNSDYDDGEAAFWIFDGLAWIPSIP